ncbi:MULTISPECIES: hypothetical protein [unclassified Actinoplanes]|uniref:hypothetical protein n=1 Tax=unclassified Actinoplanes TaxID=2626549 RepID=UPI0005B90207|nr:MULTISPECIES: hypothetical protein [unclassified Actinoplanes]
MSSQHRHVNRNYRPADDEYDPVRAEVERAGFTMNTFFRAVLRWVRNDPRRLAQFKALMVEVDAETPRGRPKKNAPQE